MFFLLPESSSVRHVKPGHRERLNAEERQMKHYVYMEVRFCPLVDACTSVLFLLPPHCSSYYLQEFLIGCSRAQTVSQRYLGVSEQTHLQHTHTHTRVIQRPLTDLNRKHDMTQLRLTQYKAWLILRTTSANHTHTQKHTFRLPSAVMRRRLQEPQKWSDMEVMKPSWPWNPGTLKAWDRAHTHTHTNQRIIPWPYKLRIWF